jgi:hypothetical protein
MDFLTRLFPQTGPYDPSYYTQDLYLLITTLLSWDIVKGGLVFFLALMIGGYVVQRVRQGFN